MMVLLYKDVNGGFWLVFGNINILLDYWEIQ